MVTTVAAALLGWASAAAYAARAEVLEAPEELRTKLQMEKLKRGQSSPRSKEANDSSKSDSELTSSPRCGEINIGNNESSKGTSAITRRDTTIIIDGNFVVDIKCPRK
jgi:hypothetical protein